MSKGPDVLSFLSRDSSKKTSKVKPALRNRSISPSIEAMASTVSYEDQISQLKSKLDSMNEVAIMPISKKKVTYTFALIDPKLIDISDHNLRNQNTLSLNSVDDIYDLILENGQQQPGILRPKEGGRYECIDGSRRLYVVRNISDRLYFAKIGEIPDEDIDLISRSANISLPISDYEWGLHYLTKLPMYGTENKLCIHFAKEDAISKDTVRNRMEIAKLPTWIVDLYHTPNDISTTKVSSLSAVLKDSRKLKLVKGRAEKLKSEINEHYNETGEWPKHPFIITHLMDAVKEIPIAKEIIKEVIKDKTGKVLFTHKSDSDGTHQYALHSPSETHTKAITKFLKELLG